MALQGTSLDERPPRPEEGKDPRLVTLMKQYGIWHPGLVYPPGSRLAIQEQEIMAKIHDDLSREDIQKENVAMRKDTQEQNAFQRQEALNQRADYQAGLAADRETRNATLNEAVATRRAQQLQFMASDQNLDEGTRNAAKAQLVKELGLSVGGQKPAATGDYGPGGAQASTGSPEQPGYPTPTAAFTAEPPTQPQGQPATNPLSSEQILSQVPAGYDYNVSTGQYLPKSTVGMINGRPAGQVIAEGAQKTGIKPESPSGLSAYAGLFPNPPPKPEVATLPTTNYTAPTNLFAPAAQPQAPSAPILPPPTPGQPVTSEQLPMHRLMNALGATLFSKQPPWVQPRRKDELASSPY